MPDNMAASQWLMALAGMALVGVAQTKPNPAPAMDSPEASLPAAEPKTAWYLINLRTGGCI